jgi:hypothetical protein
MNRTSEPKVRHGWTRHRRRWVQAEPDVVKPQWRNTLTVHVKEWSTSARPEDPAGVQITIRVRQRGLAALVLAAVGALAKGSAGWPRTAAPASEEK